MAKFIKCSQEKCGEHLNLPVNIELIIVVNKWRRVSDGNYVLTFISESREVEWWYPSQIIRDNDYERILSE